MTRAGYQFTAVLVAAYLLLLLIQDQSWIDGTLLRNYAADLLCMPILLILTSIVLRKVKGVEHLSIAHLVFAWGYVSVAFEWILPQLSTRYTGDGWDVLCYGIGTVLFYGVRRFIFDYDSLYSKRII